MSGAEILEVLCEHVKPHYAMKARDIVGALRETHDEPVDGRAISRKLHRLVDEGLVALTRNSHSPVDRYAPTARGREVDAILQRITVARGGTFMPRKQAGIDHRESFALR